MSLRGRVTGEIVTVKSRAWDCPSCGLDKQRTIAEMCSEIRGPLRMITGTFQQPLFLPDEPPPARHLLCDARSHVWENFRAGGRRQWRLLASCPHCCRYVSGVIALWRKRLRRRFGAQVSILWGREDHPSSGALHVHMAVTGIPPMGRRTRTGRWVKAQWGEVGGGFMDLGEIFTNRQKAGWYIGKYLAKRHDQSMAKGYRRWSRTQNFAPHVVMNPQLVGPELAPRVVQGWLISGWLHPVTEDLWATRIWLAEGSLPPSPG